MFFWFLISDNIQDELGFYKFLTLVTLNELVKQIVVASISILSISVRFIIIQQHTCCLLFCALFFRKNAY